MHSILSARLSDAWKNIYFVFIYFTFLSFREDWFALLFSLSQVFFTTGCGTIYRWSVQFILSFNSSAGVIRILELKDWKIRSIP